MIRPPLICRLNDVPVGSVITFPQYTRNKQFLILSYDMAPFDGDCQHYYPLELYHRLFIVGSTGIIETRVFGDGSALQEQFDYLWRIIALPQ